MVVAELSGRDIPVFRCDAAEFPERVRLAAVFEGGRWTGDLSTRRWRVALEEIRSVYYRRPSRFQLNAGMTPVERRFADGEARIGFGGVLSALDCAWINHPHANARAGYKPVQLRAAAASGLTVPATAVTNDPVAARRFVERAAGDVVYKALSRGPATEAGRPVALYTSVVCTDMVARADVGRTAHQFQHRVPAAAAVRLTVVDDRLFAARIDTASPTKAVDWRADYASLRYCVIDVPEPVRVGVLSLMSRLGLRFGALDFVVDADGGYHFLEVNPNGQWGWIEAATGMPIAAAIADALEERP